MAKKSNAKQQQNPFLQHCKNASKKTNNYQYVLDYLAKNPSLVIEDLESHETILNKPIIEQKVSSLDEEFISFLLADVKITELFFKSVGNLTIFNQQQFLELVFNTNEHMSQSHTRYKNKIGLASEHGSVVLNFPFKDCTLVGGMTVAEQGAKIEVFYNEVLDKNYIDKLFQPKLLTKAVKLAIGNKTVVETVPTEIGTQDNLVIKGNNLIALHTLKAKFKEQVDVIYIDPPYYFDETKPSDTFTYNSNFKLSSWLTFMKNRLDIAKQLMSERGVIFISTNFQGLAELKLLCDTIFDRENHVETLFVLDNLKGNNNTPYFADVGEYCLVYTKNKKAFTLKELYLQEDESWEKDDKGYWKKGRNLKATGENAPREKRPTMYFPLYIADDLTFSLTKSKKHYIELYPKTGSDELCWNWSKEKFLAESDEVLIFKSKDGFQIHKKQRPEVADILSKKPKNLFYRPEYSTTASSNTIKDLFGGREFNYAKSVALIKDLIQIASSKDSLILDFFGGSGTTGQAILELNKEDGGNRRFIMVEQLDYAQSLTLERVKRAAVKYDYTANIIYAELKQSTVKQELLNSTTIDKIVAVIEGNFDLGYFQNIEDKETLIEMIRAESDIEIVKKGLIEHIFDHNQEYYSISDFAEAVLADAEVKLNRHFFGLE